MPLINIKGIPVDFPKQPYPCQVEYMEKVIDALNKNQNALLESPTGTGKTLCLLCATLAWQKVNNAGKETAPAVGKVEIHRQPTLFKGPTDNRKSNYSVIVYATRTHSQLAQVVDELRATNYRPRMSVLGSREQLCIHEKVSKLKGSVLNHACNSLNSRRGCMYKNNLESFVGSAVSSENEILDVEDLNKIGQSKKICPYFYTRDFSANADIVFMPYNYLLDSTIRKTIKLPWENAIVIFDEAHNLERVASDAASFSISSADIASCIQELQQVVKSLKDEFEMKKNEKSSENDKKISGEVTSGSVEKPTLVGSVNLLKAMFLLEKRLDEVPLYPIDKDQPPSSTQPGSWLVQAYLQSGFHNELQLEELKRCSNMLMEAAEEALQGVDEVLGGHSAPAHATEPKLNIFLQTFERILRSKNGYTHDYKVYICEEVVKKTNKLPYAPLTASGGIAGKKKVINFWCFSTGVALSELSGLGIKSMLLTSGTLSPLEALKEDLRIPFPIELQNPHVINPKQMCITALASGITGKTLNSSFANRENVSYKDELGETIAAINKKLVEADAIPPAAAGQRKMSAKGGILVFFPSYHIMESTVERWKFTGVYDKLKSAIGYIIVEPKGSSGKNANQNDNSSSSSTNNPQKNFMLEGSVSKPNKAKNEPEDEAFNGIINEFDNAIAQIGSCLLLAVCRGKVSEGIDFSDNKGRVVVVTGIPFAPYMDPWVMLKKQYLDEKTNPAKSASSNSLNSAVQANPITTALSAPIDPNNPWLAAKQAASLIPTSTSTNSLNNRVSTALTSSPSSNFTGQMWYFQSASRAVNQCLGRVIRHCKDWGAVFLLDERFLQEKQISQLSKWMRPIVKKSSSCSDSLKNFSSFLQNITNDPALYFQPQAIMPPPPTTAELLRKIGTNRFPSKSGSGGDPFTRVVEINESQLDGPGYEDEAGEGNEGNERTYIRKELLMSQHPGNSSGSGDHFEKELNAYTQILSSSAATTRRPNAPPKEDAQQQPALDLFSLIEKMKGKSKPAGSTSFTTLTSRNGSWSSKRGEVIELDGDADPEESSSSIIVDNTDAAMIEDGPFSIYSQTSAINSFSNNFSQFDGQSQQFLKPVANSSSANPPIKKAKFGLQSSVSVSSAFTLTQAEQSTQLPPPQSQSQSQATAGPFSQAAAAAAGEKKPALYAISAQAIKVKDEFMSSAAQINDFKSILNRLQSTCSSDQIEEIKVLLLQTKQKKGIQFVSQVKEFQTSLIQILAKSFLDKNKKKKELSYEEIEEILKLFVIIIPPTNNNNSSNHNNASSSSSSISTVLQEDQQKNQMYLREFYLNSVKSQVYHLLYQRKVTPTTTIIPPNADNTTSSSSSLLSQRTQLFKDVPANNSLLGTGKDNLLSKSSAMKRKYTDILGNEDIQQSGASSVDLLNNGREGTNLGSQRAMKILQLTQHQQQQNKSSLSSSARPAPLPNQTSSGKDLFDRIRNFSESLKAPAAANPSTSSSSAGQLKEKENSLNSRLLCTICKEVASVPCANKDCGHICCQNCWLEWLKIKAICPMCREPVRKENISKIVIRSNKV